MVDYGLKDKVVVVTGGGGGIGLATTEAFLAQGARVVVGDLRPPRPDAFGGDANLLSLELDFNEEGAAAALVETAKSAHGSVDVLFNNVGAARRRNSFLDVEDEEWMATLSLNFLTVVRTCRAAIPLMLEQGKGAIVNTASSAAREPHDYFVDYSVTKAAILNLSKALALEFGHRGIRCNCVSPGPTRTKAMEGLVEEIARDRGLSMEKAFEYFAQDMRHLMLPQVNEPADVANVVLFLAGDLASQVTGADYSVDAGAIKTI